MDRVQIGMQIESIPLFHADFWVQIHNLPAGFMTEKVGIKLGNYIGVFMEYDKNNNTSFWRQYMRVRVKVDVRQPLKKDQKVRDKAGAWCTVNFKYEKLGVFCFVCGIMGHAENKCEVRFAMENDNGRRDWSGDLRANQRRGGGRQTSWWLREERDGGNRMTGDDGRDHGRSTVETPNMGPTTADMSATAQNLPRQNNTTLIINHGSPSPLLNCHDSNRVDSSNTNQNCPPITLAETDNNCPAASFYSATSNRQPGRQHLLLSETDRQNQSLGNSFPLISVTELPHLYCQTNPNQNQSIHLPNQINTSLLPNNNPIFTTQSKLPIPLKQYNRKQLILNRTQPSNNTTRPDPRSTRSYLNPNPTEPTTEPNRTGPGPVNPNPAQTSAVDMDSHTERKRRREEKKQSEQNNEEPTQHFLSAGPGSQDCREQ
jgi:hypothetical protein